MSQKLQKSIAWLSSDTRAPILIDSTVCLGRSKNCDVILLDPDVSRRHAAIHPSRDNEYWLADLGGRNGVYVNDLRINHSVRLQHGDLIRILRHTFRFLRSDSASFSPGKELPTEFSLADGSIEARWLLVAEIQEGVRWGAKQGGAQYSARLDQWYRRCRETIEGRTGIINKFMGAGFLASWIQNADTVDQVRQALNELHELQKTGDVPFRLVLHLGEVTVGSVGSAGGESLLGPQMNYVFRMEKAASVNGYSSLISGPAAEKLSPSMQLESAANLDDLTFGSNRSFFTLPGNQDRSVSLSDSDGDATDQTIISPNEEP